MTVSAVVVSRMDRPIAPVLASILLHVEELIVVRGHDGVWERWEAVSRCKCDVIYTQDDDAVINVPAVLAAYQPGLVTCNMPKDHRPDYPDDIALVGWGAVFDREMVWGGNAEEKWWTGAFGRYMDGGYDDPVFRRECDRVFTGLSPLKLIDVGKIDLPHAHGADRMGREARHGTDLAEIRRRIYAIRAAAK